MKPILNKWQFFCKIDKDYCRAIAFSKVLNIGIIKITSMPPQGAELYRQNHKGIGFRMCFWWPIDSAWFY